MQLVRVLEDAVDHAAKALFVPVAGSSSSVFEEIVIDVIS